MRSPTRIRTVFHDPPEISMLKLRLTIFTATISKVSTCVAAEDRTQRDQSSIAIRNWKFDFHEHEFSSKHRILISWNKNWPRKISPKDPLPIFLPSLYFPPTTRSISVRLCYTALDLAPESHQIKRERRFLSRRQKRLACRDGWTIGGRWVQ